MPAPMTNQQKRDAIACSIPLKADLGNVFVSFERSHGRPCICLSLPGGKPGRQMVAAEQIKSVADIAEAVESCLTALRKTTTNQKGKTSGKKGH